MPGQTGYRIIIILFALIIPCYKAGAISNSLDKNAVFVSVIPEAGTDIPKLGEIISDSAAIQLKRIGYTTYFAASDSKINSLFKLSRDKDASSLILVTYTTKETSAVLDFSLFDVENEEKRASVSLSSEIDLTLDDAITKSLTELIEKSGIEPPDPTRKQDNNLGTVEGVTTDGKALQLDTGVAPHKYLHLSAGFAPFIAVGRTLDYFSIGMEPSVLVGLLFNKPVDFLQVGLLLRTTIFTAQGALIETDNYLISAAPDIRFLISPSTAFSVYIHLAGGPTAFFLNNEKIGVYWKVIPFASGGTGVSFALNSVLGLTVNVDYSVYFEQSLFIMGVSPSMHAVFSF